MTCFGSRLIRLSIALLALAGGSAPALAENVVYEIVVQGTKRALAAVPEIRILEAPPVKTLRSLQMSGPTGSAAAPVTAPAGSPYPYPMSATSGAGSTLARGGLVGLAAVAGLVTGDLLAHASLSDEVLDEDPDWGIRLVRRDFEQSPYRYAVIDTAEHERDQWNKTLIGTVQRAISDEDEPDGARRIAIFDNEADAREYFRSQTKPAL